MKLRSWLRRKHQSDVQNWRCCSFAFAGCRRRGLLRAPKFFDLSEARSRPYRRRGRFSAVSTCICWLRKSKPVSILKSLRMPPVEQRSCCASTERGGSSSRECRSERFSCLPCCIRDILLDYLVLLLSTQAEETQLRLFQPPPPALAQLAARPALLPALLD